MSEDKRTKVCFLLGAGFSMPAEFPSTNQITSRVVLGNDVTRHTDSNYYLTDRRKHQFGDTTIVSESIVPFLRCVADDIKTCYKSNLPDYEVNYEEIYFAVQQLFDDVTFEYENPLLRLAQERARAQASQVSNLSRFPEGYCEFLQECLNYIRDIVREELSPTSGSLNYMSAISDALSDNQIAVLGVYTLNHDLLFEQHLKEKSHLFNDGLVAESEWLRVWSVENFDRQDAGVPIIHLHGHVRLFRMLRCGNGPRLQLYGNIQNSASQQFVPGQDAIKDYWIDSRPELLVGTGNKIQEYQFRVFAEMQCLMLRQLKDCGQVVLCGYGLRDKAINTKLVEWVLADGSRRLVIVHPEPENLRRTARTVFSTQWDRLVQRQQLLTLAKPIEATDWPSIRALIISN